MEGTASPTSRHPREVSPGRGLALFLLPLSQSHARAAAVLVDEFDAGGPQRGAYLHPRLVATAQRALLSFQPLYRRDRHISRRSQIPL